MSSSVDWDTNEAGCKRCDGRNCAEGFDGFELVYDENEWSAYVCVREEISINLIFVKLRMERF